MQDTLISAVSLDNIEDCVSRTPEEVQEICAKLKDMEVVSLETLRVQIEI